MAASRTFTRSALLHVGPLRAWEALVRPDLLGAWLGVDLDVEVAPGGLGTARDEDGLRLVQFDVVAAPDRLVWTWWPLEGDAPPSVVDLRLEPAEDGTRLTVTETALPDLPTGRSDAARGPLAAVR